MSQDQESNGAAKAGGLMLLIMGGVWAYRKMNSMTNCSVCDSMLTINKRCLHCNQPVCGDCGINVADPTVGEPTIPTTGRCCKNHLADWRAGLPRRAAAVKAQRQAHEAELARQREMEELHQARVLRAEAEASSVVSYSAGFKGRVENPRLNKWIETEFYDDQDQARFQLKVLTVLEGSTIVQQVSLERGVSKAGYTHSVWKARGLI